MTPSLADAMRPWQDLRFVACPECATPGATLEGAPRCGECQDKRDLAIRTNQNQRMITTTFRKVFGPRFANVSLDYVSDAVQTLIRIGVERHQPFYIAGPASSKKTTVAVCALHHLLTSAYKTIPHLDAFLHLTIPDTNYSPIHDSLPDLSTIHRLIVIENLEFCNPERYNTVIPFLKSFNDHYPGRLFITSPLHPDAVHKSAHLSSGLNLLSKSLIAHSQIIILK